MDSSDAHRDRRGTGCGETDLLTVAEAVSGECGARAPDTPVPAGAVLGEVFRSQYRQLLRFCRMRVRNTADAEDIVQGAFLSARRAYPDKGIEELGALLFTLVRNKTLDHLGAPWNSRRDGEDIGTRGAQLACPRSPTPEKQLIDAQRLAIVEEVLAGMSPRRQAALRLHRFDGRSYEDIARQLSISATAAKKHVARAVAEIAIALADAEGQDDDPAG